MQRRDGLQSNLMALAKVQQNWMQPNLGVEL
jgi:hypothetical protein